MSFPGHGLFACVDRSAGVECKCTNKCTVSRGVSDIVSIIDIRGYIPYYERGQLIFYANYLLFLRDNYCDVF